MACFNLMSVWILESKHYFVNFKKIYYSTLLRSTFNYVLTMMQVFPPM